MKTPVYLAIPNYNMASQLERLLPTTFNAGYEHIYVLDDCSSDRSQSVVEHFKNKGVSFVSNDHNKGAGATRNTILDYQRNGIVHFLDADVTINEIHNGAAEIASAFERHPDAGAIGFRVINPDKTQYGWNFGPTRTLTDGLTWKSLDMYGRTSNPIIKAMLHKIFQQRWHSFWTYTHPDSAEREQEVGAAVECNLAVRLEDFQKVHGFDESLRFHEIHSLALKLRSIGRTIWYVPHVSVTKYDDVEVRSNRKRDMQHSQLLLDFKRLTGKYTLK